MRLGGVTFLIAILVGLVATSQAIEREDVLFSVDFNTVLGQSVYVVGDIPELGNGDPAFAPKLEPSTFPIWKATIAIPAGTQYSYQYTWRDDSVQNWSDSSNHNPFGAVINASTAPGDPRPAKKGMYYHSGWTQPTLNWRTSSSDSFATVTMQDFGQGRTESERRWRAIGIGEGERWIEFFFTDGQGGRDPSSGNYRTRLDAFFVQDGQVFDYTPASSVGPQRRDYSPSNPPGINSVNLGEFRRYRVFLPRGYDDHPNKSYPAIYMHDGQNIFEFGPFGSWQAHLALNDLARNGVMREVIVVGIDNTSNRARDYIPPDDIVPIGPGSGQPGRADDYAAFIINELKPIIDANYRTLPDRDNTGTIGSSLGGVVSLYLGWDLNSTFSRCGPMSGSWFLNNFPARVLSEPNRPLRVYLDSGDCCSPSFDGAWGTMNLRDALNAKGYVLERDMQHVVGYGDQHNEAAWASRVGFAFEFLFPATESENPLIEEIFTGDLDDDGDINDEDFAIFEPCFGAESGEPLSGLCLDADFDADGDVDCDDFDTFATFWSDDAPPPTLPACLPPDVPVTSWRSMLAGVALMAVAFSLARRSTTHRIGDDL